VNPHRKIIGGWLKNALLALLLSALAVAPAFAQVGGPPVITVQPSNQTVLIGDTALFSVVAVSGTTMSYQWRKYGTNLAGATQSTFTLNPVQSSDAADYSVRIVNAGGAVVSTNATLTVLASAAPGVGAAGEFACVSATNVSSHAWLHTVGGGSNRVLLVGIALTKSSEAVTGVTYGGVPLFRVAAATNGNPAELWCLVAPRVGKAEIVATFTGNKDMVGWSGTFTNVDQINPVLNTAVTNGSTLTAQVSLAATTGSLVVDTLATSGDVPLLLPGAGQTVICQNTTGSGGGNCWSASSHKPGAAGVSMSWQLGTGKSWGLVAAALRAATNPQADVGVVLTGAANTSTETNFSHTVRITNLGPQTASNVLVRDTLPAGLIFVGASAGGMHSNGLVTWLLPSLVSGDATNLTLLLRATNGGTFTNLVTVTSATSDPQPANNTAVLLTSVAWPNSPPTAQPQSLSTLDGTAKTIALTGNDPDDNALLFTLATLPAHGVLSGFDPNSGIVTYTPHAGYTGPDSFSFRVFDGWTSSAPATVSISVLPIAPSILLQPQPARVMAGQMAVFTVNATGSPLLSYQWHFNGAVLAGATGATLTLTNVQTDAAGTYSVSITNGGGTVTSDPAALTVARPALATPPALETPALATNGFSFQFAVPAGATYVIRASTNLHHWTAIATNVAQADKETFTDIQAANFNGRCYQVVILEGTAPLVASDP
jgi:uncharacterized repeat protein (TIGR01451 family)